MYIAVCDDDIIEKGQIVRAINKTGLAKSIENFDNPLKLLEKMKENRFDVIFLDIMMPSMNGIETAKEIRKIDPEVFIVFISGYDNFGLEAFSTYAIDYILKPLNTERLHKTIHRIYEKLNQSQNKVIEIKTQNAVYCEKQSDIILIEKVGYYCVVHTELSTFEVPSPIKYFEELLDNRIFVRCHSGYIVNKLKIARIEANGNLSYTIHFKSIDKTALVSRGKKQKLLDNFNR